MTTLTAQRDTRKTTSYQSRLLRLEGLALAVASLALYHQMDYRWLTLGLLWIIPDLALLVFIVDNEKGVTLYNLVHTTTWPLMLAVAGMLVDSGPAVQLALIWLFHIGLDRIVGYGLKYTADKGDTHFGRV
jgi:uncharacterized integral membrane protein